MSKRNHLFWGFALCTILLTACQKENDNSSSNYRSLSDFFDKKEDLETFTVDLSEEVLITGKKGTNLSIPLGSIKDSDGNPVSGGTTIELMEIFTKSDMVLNNKPTQTLFEDLLESGGSFYLDIQQGGRRLNRGNTVSLNFPINDQVSDTNNMSAWWGRSLNIFELSDNETFYWSVADSNVVTVDSSTNAFTMGIPFPETEDITWINCDYVFESTAPRVEVSAKPINLISNLGDVSAYIVLKDINAVAAMYYTFSENKFTSFALPIGEEANLVIIALDVDSGQFYLKVAPFTITENLNLELELEKVTEEDLVKEIESLD